MLRNIIFGDDTGVLGINRRNLNYVYPGVNRRMFRIADQKLLSKELFKECNAAFPETLTTFERFGHLMEIEKKMEGLQKFVIKPNRGRQGSGIFVLGEKTDGGWVDVRGRIVTLKQIRKHIADILMGVYSSGSADTAIVESRIYPHAFLADIYDKGLSDIRLIAYRQKPVMAMLRVPTSYSGGKANLHQGGIGIGLDLNTGLTTNAIYKGNSISKHPDTKVPLTGLRLPFQKEILETALRIARAVSLKYIGFDFTLDAESGPMLLEMNARPGLEIQNANQAGLREALENV